MPKLPKVSQVLLVATLFSGTAIANIFEPTRCEQLITALKSTWPKEAGCYDPDHCNDNVLNILNRLAGNGLDPNKAKILYFFTVHPFDAVNPQLPRNDGDYWRFHAVVEYEGRILDTDYSDKARVPTVANYVRTMFGKGNVDFSLIKVKTIPVEAYQKMREDKGKSHFVYHLNDETAAGEQSLKDFVAAHNPQQKPTQVASIYSSAETRLFDRHEVEDSRVANMRKLNEIGAGQSINLLHSYKFFRSTPTWGIETSGTIVSVGEKSLQIKVGDKVETIPLELISPASIKRIGKIH